METNKTRLAALPLNSCKVGDVREHKRKPVERDEDRRKRIRNRKKLALQNRTVGEDLLRDSFKRAKGV